MRLCFRGRIIAFAASTLFWMDSGLAEEVVPVASLPAVDPCLVRGEDVQEYGLWERSYNVVSSGVCFPSRWVDRFFEDPDSISADPAHTQLRIIYAERWQDNGETGDEVRVRARVQLPNLQERWSLVFRNDEDLTDGSEELDRDPATVGTEDDDETTARAALRWARELGKREDIDVDVGVGSELKTFVRGRYQYRQPIGSSPWWFRFGEEVFWEDPEGWGAQTSVEFDRPLTTRVTFRLNNELEWSEERNQQDIGLGWLQTASLYQSLGKRSAIQYLVGWSGDTKPITAVGVIRTAIRLRRSVWKPWFYYEIEPYAFWPRSDDFHGVTGIVGRVEIQLGRYD